MKKNFLGIFIFIFKDFLVNTSMCLNKIFSSNEKHFESHYKSRLCLIRILTFLVIMVSFVMPMSYGRYWEALYVEGNEVEGILILRSILLLFLPLFL